MSLKTAFAAVLKNVRATRGLSQKNLAEVSSRTYISKLERAQCSPTLEMITTLSEPLSLSPLTLVALTLGSADELSANSLVRRLENELAELKDAGILEKLHFKSEAAFLADKKPTGVRSKSQIRPTQQVEFCFAD